jgi:hypothetical protein
MTSDDRLPMVHACSASLRIERPKLFKSMLQLTSGLRGAVVTSLAQRHEITFRVHVGVLVTAHAAEDNM